MKKLKLSSIGLILSKAQMRSITGGYGSCDERPCTGTVYECTDVTCTLNKRISCKNDGNCVPL